MDATAPTPAAVALKSRHHVSPLQGSSGGPRPPRGKSPQPSGRVGRNISFATPSPPARAGLRQRVRHGHQRPSELGVSDRPGPDPAPRRPGGSQPTGPQQTPCRRPAIPPRPGGLAGGTRFAPPPALDCPHRALHRQTRRPRFQPPALGCMSRQLAVSAKRAWPSGLGRARRRRESAVARARRTQSRRGRRRSPQSQGLPVEARRARGSVRARRRPKSRRRGVRGGEVRQWRRKRRRRRAMAGCTLRSAAASGQLRRKESSGRLRRGRGESGAATALDGSGPVPHDPDAAISQACPLARQGSAAGQLS